MYIVNDYGADLIMGLILYRYFDYLFYVDFEASMAEQSAQNALRHLKV